MGRGGAAATCGMAAADAGRPAASWGLARTGRLASPGRRRRGHRRAGDHGTVPDLVISWQRSSREAGVHDRRTYRRCLGTGSPGRRAGDLLDGAAVRTEYPQHLRLRAAAPRMRLSLSVRGGARGVDVGPPDRRWTATALVRMLWGRRRAPLPRGPGTARRRQAGVVESYTKYGGHQAHGPSVIRTASIDRLPGNPRTGRTPNRNPG